MMPMIVGGAISLYIHFDEFKILFAQVYIMLLIFVII